MAKVIVLDSTPVGLITNPKPNPQAKDCQQWILQRLNEGDRLVFPEIVDYEIRRELLRANRLNSIRKLDQLKQELIYVPLTTATMNRAAELWAQARKQGKPTANNQALDGDVILAAQALMIQERGHDVVIATSNVKHLALFLSAKIWQEIF